jgi:hypothetical protein
MAHTNNGCKVSAPDEHLPSTYVRPSITEIQDWKYKARKTFSVLKGTVENATPNTTVANIIANASIGINKQVTDMLALEYISTLTLVAFTDIVAISETNQPPATGNMFKNVAPSYLVTCDVYVKTGL